MKFGYIKIAERYKYCLLIFLLIAFHSINNYFWIKQDSESMGWDVPQHINMVVPLNHEFKNIFFSNLSFSEKFKLFGQSFFSVHIASLPFVITFPRLVHSIAALISFMFKDILFYIRFSNIIYFVILIVSIYLLGKKIHSPKVGIISAYLISFYPSVFGLSRKFGLDFPLLAMACLMMYFLLRCDEFHNRLFSVMFGISLGLGMLVKGQCIFFIIGPLLYVILKGLKKRQYKSHLNVFIAISIALLISLIWWHKIFSIEGYFAIRDHIFSRHPLSKFKNGSIFEELMYYLKAIYSNISPVFFIFFLMGLFFYLKNINNSQYPIIFIWFLASYFILYLIPTKNERYVFPVFGAIALISVTGWLQALSFRQSLKVILLLIIFGFYQFFAISYFKHGYYYFVSNNINREWAHSPEQNNHKLIMKEFNEIIQNQNNSFRNIAIIEEYYFSGDPCVRLSYLLKVFNKKNRVYLSSLGAQPYHVSDEFLANISNYDVLVMFSKYSDQPDYRSSQIFVSKAIEEFKKFKIFKKEILLPEKINIFLLIKS